MGLDFGIKKRRKGKNYSGLLLDVCPKGHKYIFDRK